MSVDLHKVKSNAFIFSIMLLAALSVGMLFIAVFFRGFFESADNFRLLVISLAVTLPFLVLNTLIIYILTDRPPVDKNNEKEVEEEWFLMGFLSANVCTLMFLVPTAFGFFLNLTNRKAVLIVLVMEACLIGMARSATNRRKKARASQAEKTS